MSKFGRDHVRTWLVPDWRFTPTQKLSTPVCECAPGLRAAPRLGTALRRRLLSAARCELIYSAQRPATSRVRVHTWSASCTKAWYSPDATTRMRPFTPTDTQPTAEWNALAAPWLGTAPPRRLRKQQFTPMKCAPKAECECPPGLRAAPWLGTAPPRRLSMHNSHH